MSQQVPFEKEFEMLRELGEKTFVLRGSTIIVYELPDEEIKTQGGLIIATDSRQVGGNSVEQNRLKVGKVLMTGPGYWDENGDEVWNNSDTISPKLVSKGSYIPLDVKPGAIVILPQFSTSVLSTFPGIAKPTGNKLHMCKESEILAYYPSQEAYLEAKKKLN